jgi:Protein of unknown function (DUF3127).
MFNAKGTIVKVLPKTSGITGKGNMWEKQEYVLEHSEKYHTKMKFSICSFDGPIENSLNVGDKVDILFDIESREYKGNWYNDIKAYSVTK